MKCLGYLVLHNYVGARLLAEPVKHVTINVKVNSSNYCMQILSKIVIIKREDRCTYGQKTWRTQCVDPVFVPQQLQQPSVQRRLEVWHVQWVIPSQWQNTTHQYSYLVPCTQHTYFQQSCSTDTDVLYWLPDLIPSSDNIIYYYALLKLVHSYGFIKFVDQCPTYSIFNGTGNETLN